MHTLVVLSVLELRLEKTIRITLQFEEFLSYDFWAIGDND